MINHATIDTMVVCSDGTCTAHCRVGWHPVYHGPNDLSQVASSSRVEELLRYLDLIHRWAREGTGVRPDLQRPIPTYDESAKRAGVENGLSTLGSRVGDSAVT